MHVANPGRNPDSEREARFLLNANLFLAVIKQQSRKWKPRKSGTVYRAKHSLYLTSEIFLRLNSNNIYKRGLLIKWHSIKASYCFGSCYNFTRLHRLRSHHKVKVI